MLPRKLCLGDTLAAAASRFKCLRVPEMKIQQCDYHVSTLTVMMVPVCVGTFADHGRQTLDDAKCMADEVFANMQRSTLVSAAPPDGQSETVLR